MKVKLSNVRFDEVKPGKHNAGTVFVRADIKSVGTGLICEKWLNYPLFDNDIVELLQPYFSKAEHGTAEVTSPIPDDILTIDGAMSEIYVFNEPMVRIDEAGMPIKNKNGIVKTYNSCRVLTIWRFEDMINKWIPVQGWSKEEKGQSLIGTLYDYASKHSMLINGAFAGVQAPMAPANMMPMEQPAPQPTPVQPEQQPQMTQTAQPTPQMTQTPQAGNAPVF